MSGIEFEFFMFRVKHIRDLKDDDKTKISMVYYDGSQSSCILRICKGRDLSGVYTKLKEIRHPNISVIYDCIYENGNTYVIEEYIPGESVESVLQKKGVFSADETSKIISAVCKGLSVLHKLNPPVVHNDIKPSNIMLCEDGNIKLFDFDISRVYKADATQNTQLFGTAGCASPEHYGIRQTEPASDIYSLGATIHQMLTGKVFEGKPKILCRGMMKKIIGKCIEFDPERRYASVNHLLKDLKKYENRRKRFLKKFLAISLALVIGICLVLYSTSDKTDGSTDNLMGIFEKQENKTSFFSGEESFDSDNTISTGKTEDTADGETQTGKQAPINHNISGEIKTMITLNDGNVVYLIDGEEGHLIKTSAGQTVSLENIDGFYGCELAYNKWTDTLYLLDYSASEDSLVINVFNKDYSFDNVLKVQLKYHSSIDDAECYFFSDGTMLCNTAQQEIIDIKLGETIGDFEGGNVDAIIKDRVFRMGTDAIYEINLNGDVGNTYVSHLLAINYSVYSDGDYIYFIGSNSGKDYLCRFDGVKYEDVICLSDYKYYVSEDFDALCVTDDALAVYYKSQNVIKEFKF